MELNLEKLINDAVEKQLNELYGKNASFAENDAVVFTPQEAVEFLGSGIFSEDAISWMLEQPKGKDYCIFRYKVIPDVLEKRRLSNTRA